MHRRIKLTKKERRKLTLIKRIDMLGNVSNNRYI